MIVSCLVTATPGDLSQEIHLGAYMAPSPRLAIRWLQGQATRLVTALDPQPGVGWAVGGAERALRKLPDSMPRDWPDPGQRLTKWLSDERQHEEIKSALSAGHPFTMTTRDFSAYYTFLAQPRACTFTYRSGGYGVAA